MNIYDDVDREARHDFYNHRDEYVPVQQDVVLDLTGPEAVWEVSRDQVIAWLEGQKGTLHDRLMAHEAIQLLRVGEEQ